MPSRRLTATAVLALCVADAAAQVQPPDAATATVNLLTRHSSLKLPAYVPKVPTQIVCLRSDEEATRFCTAAWGEEKEALHVDFAHEQVIAVAWGALRFAEGSAGTSTEILLERAEIRDDTLFATVRTVLGPGPDIDIAAERPGRTWYPSLFFHTPRTERVVVDLIGARRHDGNPDFRPVTEPDLEVRVGPDACPARERFTQVRRQHSAKTPTFWLDDRDGRTVLEVAWGEFGPGLYPTGLVGMLVDHGTARLTLRAASEPIDSYGGPGVERPGLAVVLPPVTRVLVHIERTGLPVAAGHQDFEPRTDGPLTVTVDRSQLFE